ncbi:MAG: heterodisulfide reductase-related iron-sulfur binding cluster [Desulfocapsaceae bacterium]|nr:heterodisulfide reductase-related iron-sulfur binding cluster [Desulfocapsaceae bacterium]
MRLSYYPGCSLQGTALDYDHSVRETCARLDIDLVEIPDWNCCGASSAHMTDHEIGLRLPIRNLVLAQEAGHDILVPCAACFQRLCAADKAVRHDPERWDIESYNPGMKIIHISSLLASDGFLERITARVRKPLGDLTLACYYGCLSLRHPRITGAVNHERPETLESIVRAIGASSVSWSHKTECCSGSLTMARPDIARKLVGDIIAAARKAGAAAMVTDCPMCQANVESRQLYNAGEDPPLPVFFATELIAAALSGDYPKKQQKVHLVRPDAMTDLFPNSPTEGTA